MEIEDAIRQHASVKDVAVLGIPDPEFGEKIVAILLFKEKSAHPKKGSGTDLLCDVDEAVRSELSAWCGRLLSPYKVPRRFLVFLGDSLPRNALEKVSKKDLKSLVMKLR